MKCPQCGHSMKSNGRKNDPKGLAYEEFKCDHCTHVLLANWGLAKNKGKKKNEGFIW